MELHANFTQENQYFTTVKRDGHAARLLSMNGANSKKFKVVPLPSIQIKSLTLPHSLSLKLLIMHRRVSLVENSYIRKFYLGIDKA